jgi:uncharacterized protein YecE (DUF72 family)
MKDISNKVRIGTSGYSFEDWKGEFYPEDIQKGKMLDFYAQHFDTVEVNSTYYRIPPHHVFYHMAQKTVADFHFIVKTHSNVTHQRRKTEESIKNLLEAVKPLQEAGKLKGFLAQFPYSFKGIPANLDYVKSVQDALGDHRLFVEFRHRSWVIDEVFQAFKEHRIGFVSVDEPQLINMIPPELYVTADVAYVRFHGRNGENWYHPEKGDRYDYLYSEKELEEWVKPIKKITSHASLTYLFFNNCHMGHAVNNARTMKKLLS